MDTEMIACLPLRGLETMPVSAIALMFIVWGKTVGYQVGLSLLPGTQQTQKSAIERSCDNPQLTEQSPAF